MKPRTDFRLKMYRPTRTALSWFVLFAFGMGAYAYLNEIGSLSQVLQAVAFGAIGLAIRLTVFRNPNIAPLQSEESESDDTS